MTKLKNYSESISNFEIVDEEPGENQVLMRSNNMTAIHKGRIDAVQIFLSKSTNIHQACEEVMLFDEIVGNVAYFFMI